MDLQINNLNNEVELWLKMVDSLAHLITASTSLIRSIHKNSCDPSGREFIYRTTNETNGNEYNTHSNVLPSCFQHPFDNIGDKFLKYSQGRSYDFLDEQYRKTKQALFKRYRPETKINSQYARQNANIDFVDDKLVQDFYKISMKSSERIMDFFPAHEIAELNRINKTNSVETLFITQGFEGIFKDFEHVL